MKIRGRGAEQFHAKLANQTDTSVYNYVALCTAAVTAVFLLPSLIVAYRNITLPLTHGRLGDVCVLASLLAAIRGYVDDDDDDGGGDNGSIESRNGVS
jgi:hypothetical protein